MSSFRGAKILTRKKETRIQTNHHFAIHRFRTLVMTFSHAKDLATLVSVQKCQVSIQRPEVFIFAEK